MFLARLYMRRPLYLYNVVPFFVDREDHEILEIHFSVIMFKMDKNWLFKMVLNRLKTGLKTGIFFRFFRIVAVYVFGQIWAW